MDIEEKYISEVVYPERIQQRIDRTALIKWKGHSATINLNECSIVLMEEIVKLLKRVGITVIEKF